MKEPLKDQGRQGTSLIGNLRLQKTNKFFGMGCWLFVGHGLEWDLTDSSQVLRLLERQGLNPDVQLYNS